MIVWSKEPVDIGSRITDWEVYDYRSHTYHRVPFVVLRSATFEELRDFGQEVGVDVLPKDGGYFYDISID
jgi:hypothetical protein